MLSIFHLRSEWNRGRWVLRPFTTNFVVRRLRVKWRFLFGFAFDSVFVKLNKNISKCCQSLTWGVKLSQVWWGGLLLRRPRVKWSIASPTTPHPAADWSNRNFQLSILVTFHLHWPKIWFERNVWLQVAVEEKPELGIRIFQDGGDCSKIPQSVLLQIFLRKKPNFFMIEGTKGYLWLSRDLHTHRRKKLSKSRLSEYSPKAGSLKALWKLCESSPKTPWKQALWKLFESSPKTPEKLPKSRLSESP